MCHSCADAQIAIIRAVSYITHPGRACPWEGFGVAAVHAAELAELVLLFCLLMITCCPDIAKQETHMLQSLDGAILL